jgi:hypothetical protein
MTRPSDSTNPRAANAAQAEHLLGSAQRVRAQKLSEMFAQLDAAAELSDETEVARATREAMSALFVFDRAERHAWLRRLLIDYERRPEMFWPMFLRLWDDSEADTTRGYASRLHRVHRRRRAYDFVTAEDKRFYDSLPDPVTVYRGQEQGAPVGISQTTDRAKGEWFAQRFACLHGRPVLLVAEVHKRDVYAVFTDREESEVLCRPNVLEARALAPEKTAPSDERAAALYLSLNRERRRSARG